MNTPAPRYARPMPASRLPALTSPLPRSRPLRDRIAFALTGVVERERDDAALRIGIALGLLTGLAVVVAIVATLR